MFAMTIHDVFRRLISAFPPELAVYQITSVLFYHLKADATSVLYVDGFIDKIWRPDCQQFCLPKGKDAVWSIDRLQLTHGPASHCQ
jgi:hypothetical protein